MDPIVNQPRAVATNTAALALSRSIEGASSVFLSFFVARRLGPGGLGIYSAALVFFALIMLAAEMGSTNFLIREIARYRARTSAYLVHLGTITLTASCLVLAIALLILPHLGYSDELRTCVYVIMCGTIPGTWRTIQEAVFVAHQRVEFITYSTLAAAVFNVLITLLLLYRGFGIVSLVVAFVVVQYALATLYLLLINRYISRLHWSLHWAFAMGMIKEIRVFAGSSLLGGIFARPEIVILSLFNNEAQIGFYSAALRLVTVWSVIPQTFMTNVFPVMAEAEHAGNGQRSQRIVDKSLKFLLAVSLPLAAGLFVAARPIVHALYGPGFEASVVPLKLMAWSIPLSSISAVLWRLLAAKGDQRLVLYTQAVTTVGRLAGGYALISLFASVGAAISNSLSLLAYNLLLGFFARRNGTRIKVLRLSWRLIAAAAVMGIVTASVVNRLQLWTVIIIAAGLYTIAVFLMKPWSAEDSAMFRQIVQVPHRGVRLQNEPVQSAGASR